MEFSASGVVVYMNDGSSDEWGDNSANTSKKFPPATKSQRGGIQKFTDYGLKAVAYQKEYEKALEFPAHILRKEDMKIKDVVKEHVLPFLPAKSLTKFKAVSKEWKWWIANSLLLRYHQSYSCQSFSGYFYQDSTMGRDPMFLPLDHSSSGVPSPSLHFLPEKVNILSSCGGLLLCHQSEKYYVCNPATQVWKVLPLPHCYHGDEPAVVLAFDPSPYNMGVYYHVVCAFTILGQDFVGFEIYSSESDTWTVSPECCAELGNTSPVGGGRGLYMKGVAYFETTSNEVLAFYVKEEIAAVISLPLHVGERGSLMEMEGELCYVTANNECGNVYLIDIYGGMDMSLKRCISINLGPERDFTQSCQVLPCGNGDAVAIHVGRFIYFYYPRQEKVELITNPRAISGKRFLPYVNSLVVMLHELEK